MATPNKVRIRTGSGPVDHRIVSRKQWLKDRLAFLKKEKKFSKLGDQLAKQRRALPWVRVEKDYVFDGPGGPVPFAQLFGPQHQLIVYHFMFAPDWSAGCPHCSFWADHYDSLRHHLGRRDTAFTAISRAPIAQIESFKKRMGWMFSWVSSGQTSFNYDFNASFTDEQNRTGTSFFNFRKGNAGASDREGASVFYKDQDGAIYHTYSTFARGIDALNGTYHFLELTPKGRDEGGQEGPQDWVRHHDRYGS
ncbi:MAG TPA: DUF899 domain-containing protein [Planctomycetota bacterium]|nr:DUF899 domain-containing protein [Planctomycetota bacterium]